MITLKSRTPSPTALGRSLPDSATFRDAVCVPLVVQGVSRGWVYSNQSLSWNSSRPSAVTIGQFDGVHLGHQHLLGVTTEVADRCGLAPGAVTFDRHPMAITAPGREPRFLTRSDDKVGLLLNRGARFVAVLTSTTSLMRMIPGDFIEHVLVAALGARSVVVGPNFRFGYQASGDVATLRAHPAGNGLDVHVPPLVADHDTVVSSSAVRAAVAAGSMEVATTMLGRPHEVRGFVARDAGGSPEIAVPRNVAVPTVGRFDCLVISGEKGASRVTTHLSGTERLAVEVDPARADSGIWRSGREVVVRYGVPDAPR